MLLALMDRMKRSRVKYEYELRKGEEIPIGSATVLRQNNKSNTGLYPFVDFLFYPTVKQNS